MTPRIGIVQISIGCRWPLVVLTPIVALVICGRTAVCIAENNKLTATASPDKKVLIAKEKDPDGAIHVFFISSATGERLGSVLSLLNEGDLTDVNVLSSWNASSSKVALLVYYGVRASKIKLFKRDDTGKFVPIDLKLPDPLGMYGKPDIKQLSEEHVNASENSLGPWTSDKSVRLVSGIMVDRGDNVFVHLFVTFTAVLDGRTDIQDVKLLGPYSDQEADKFLEQWGTKYWEEPDTGANKLDPPTSPGKETAERDLNI